MVPDWGPLDYRTWLGTWEVFTSFPHVQSWQPANKQHWYSSKVLAWETRKREFVFHWSPKLLEQLFCKIQTRYVGWLFQEKCLRKGQNFCPGTDSLKPGNSIDRNIWLCLKRCYLLHMVNHSSSDPTDLFTILELEIRRSTFLSNVKLVDGRILRLLNGKGVGRGAFIHTF